jgi:hypothetical protein
VIDSSEALAGAAIGVSKAFMIKVEAQKIMCQVQIDRI